MLSHPKAGQDVQKMYSKSLAQDFRAQQVDLGGPLSFVWPDSTASLRDIFEDARSFHSTSNRRWYMKRGIPYRRGKRAKSFRMICVRCVISLVRAKRCTFHATSRTCSGYFLKGPPKCGKTHFSKLLARHLGAELHVRGASVDPMSLRTPRR